MVLDLTQNPHGHFARVLSRRLPVWIGKRSYGIYLYHFTLLGALNLPGGPLALAAGIVISFAAAALSYRYLEEPCLRLKDRRVGARGAIVVALPAQAHAEAA